MSKLVLTLEDEDMMELQEVLLDEDEKGALKFIKTCIAPKIPSRSSAHCDSTRNNPFLIKENG